jgi:hypothetical protein
VLVLLLRFNAGSANLAHYQLVVSHCLLFEPLETLIHVRRYAKHVLFETIVAQVPPAKQASDKSLFLPADLASAHAGVDSLERKDLIVQMVFGRNSVEGLPYAMQARRQVPPDSLGRFDSSLKFLFCRNLSPRRLVV